MINMYGLEIVVSHHLAPVMVGHSIEPLNAPKWSARILSWFGISPFVCWLSEPMWRDPDPLMFQGKLIVTPKQYQSLMEATESQ